MDRLTAKLVNRLTAMLANRLTATLVNRLTAKLMNHLTAKLMVVNLVKLHLTKFKLTNQLLCFWADRGFFTSRTVFAILQAEIRSRWILTEKADCQQSSLGLMTLIIHNIFLNRV